MVRWSQCEYSSICPPRAAVRQRRMAFSTFQRCRSKVVRARSANAGPAARITSATSKGGRDIALCRLTGCQWQRVERTSGGLQMPVRQVQVHGGGLQVAVAEQKLYGAQIDAGFQQVSGEAVAQRVRMNGLIDAGSSGRLLDGVPHDLVGHGLLQVVVG